ncbi:hypothetical protein BCR42DRAFT_419930 [Absidia repens]|uniref:Magnesium transporter NIPA-domain-containing protein n=1 Tax=Absidia repens TaxID=90262 RepID=A0A1X2IAF5_9FUNG|nr:hypothetical protein BCR42DRAFT_419930 [Absidia repens]
MDALGLNILKLDHVKEGQKDDSAQRGDCGRPLWHIGLYTYIASQLIGSTIALNYLKTQWVAPLGSVALIYNFIFAKILVGTNITRKDVLGTLVVVASVIWIVVFGGMYSGEDPEASISLERLKTLFTRPIFIIYFSALNIITLSGLALAIWSHWAMSDESKRSLFTGVTPKKMRRIVGLMFSLDGGLLASETLLLAKSGVKLFTLSINSQVNQFTDNTSRFIILALVITAILQVYCLNTALKLYTSVVVVPVFYGTYTALGLVNTIIYLDEIGNYPGWAISLVFAGIAVLIYGVYLLSSKPDPTSQSSQPEQDLENIDDSTQHQHHHQQVEVIDTEQEMHSTYSSHSSPLSSSSPRTTNSSIPNHTNGGNQLHSTNDIDEKSPYILPPSTTMPKQVTTTSNLATSDYQQNRSCGATTLVDEAIHNQQDQDLHNRHSSRQSRSSRWFRRMLSKTPWNAIHKREDTFLSLHSTEAGGSVAAPTQQQQHQQSPLNATEKTTPSSSIKAPESTTTHTIGTEK